MIEEFCCRNMEYYMIEKNDLLYYESFTRNYSLILHNDGCGTHQEISYCPWCGAKLPKELGEEWGEILEKEYKISEPFKNKKLVPSEFWKDEW